MVVEAAWVEAAWLEDDGGWGGASVCVCVVVGEGVLAARPLLISTSRPRSFCSGVLMAVRVRCEG